MIFIFSIFFLNRFVSPILSQFCFSGSHRSFVLLCLSLNLLDSYFLSCFYFYLLSLSLSPYTFNFSLIVFIPSHFLSHRLPYIFLHFLSAPLLPLTFPLIVFLTPSHFLSQPLYFFSLSLLSSLLQPPTFCLSSSTSSHFPSNRLPYIISHSPSDPQLPLTYSFGVYLSPSHFLSQLLYSSSLSLLSSCLHPLAFSLSLSLFLSLSLSASRLPLTFSFTLFLFPLLLSLWFSPLLSLTFSPSFSLIFSPFLSHSLLYFIHVLSHLLFTPSHFLSDLLLSFLSLSFLPPLFPLTFYLLFFLYFLSKPLSFFPLVSFIFSHPFHSISLSLIFFHIPYSFYLLFSLLPYFHSHLQYVSLYLSFQI